MKVFISSPMRGSTKEEILATRKRIEDDLRTRFKEEEITIIDSYFPEFDAARSEINISVYYLGRAILKLAEADLVVFDKGWEKARGCRIEHTIAQDYDLNILLL